MCNISSSTHFLYVFASRLKGKVGVGKSIRSLKYTLQHQSVWHKSASLKNRLTPASMDITYKNDI